MNPKVDIFIEKLENWQPELNKLRSIILECNLTEELKWGVPIYTYNNSNILGVNGLKEFCAISFFNGVLLKDDQKLLEQPGQNTQAGRWIKFKSLKEIFELEATIKAYIFEAIEIEKAGIKVEYKKTSDYPVPEEFQQKMQEIPALKTAFDALTPGRQRAYLLFFAAPKQSQTRISRIEKFTPKIMDGKGMND